jgi:hypothetical protein
MFETQWLSLFASFSFRREDVYAQFKCICYLNVGKSLKIASYELPYPSPGLHVLAENKSNVATALLFSLGYLILIY